jgi:glucose/arabinose dehydrogenase
VVGWTLAAACLLTATARAQPPRPAPLGDGPWIFDTAEGFQIRVSILTRGLSQPWSLAFLPDGRLLVTERPGRLRIVRNGTLDPQPIAGVPEVLVERTGGLMDVVLHPRFAENGLVYLTYSKPGDKGATTAIARGRLEGMALRDVVDVFVADAWSRSNSNYGGRIVFDREGMLFLSIGDRSSSGQERSAELAQREHAQDPSDHAGAILRLHDDGRVPGDNPFSKREGYRPEIYSFGHRNPQGLALHPETGALWATEHGPQGGDELNVIVAGGNYGWPVVTYGREYSGARLAVRPWQAGMEQPLLFWVPSIAVTGLTFYTGDRFPAWRGDAFVGGLVEARTAGTGHLERLVFSREEGGEVGREALLRELRQRIRGVHQGPDGLLYVLTAENDGAILRIEPAGQP